MVTFNLSHGQSRVQHTAGGMPIRFRWRSLTPKKLLMFAIDGASEGHPGELVKVRVDADENGDVEVSNPAAIQHIATLGYPIRLPGELLACGAIPKTVLETIWDEEGQRALETGGTRLDWSGAVCALGYAHEELIWRRAGATDPYADAMPDKAVHPEPWRHVPHFVGQPDGSLKCWHEGGQNG